MLSSNLKIVPKPLQLTFRLSNWRNLPKSVFYPVRFVEDIHLSLFSKPTNPLMRIPPFSNCGPFLPCFVRHDLKCQLAAAADVPWSFAYPHRNLLHRFRN